MEVKQPWHEANHSLPFSAEAKTKCKYTEFY
jgi:hypothetical protein